MAVVALGDLVNQGIVINNIKEWIEVDEQSSQRIHVSVYPNDAWASRVSASY